MRSNVHHYDLIAPPTVQAVLELLANAPNIHTPIAGGTELMVALGAGRLAPKKLISINHLRELRFLHTTDNEITIGSGTTFTDLRRHRTIAEDFPLLAQAASWTGSIANQNRGTLGGNLVNASPAADSPPALLAYEATVQLISTRGTRTLAYRDFHHAYKKTALAPDELLYSITLPRIFTGYTGSIRKVGTRNAQAISKVAIAALALMKNGLIADIKIGAASLRETPIRCTAVETALLNQPINPETIAAAKRALSTETRPIDDIRSTALYRAAVAANLLEDFLLSLRSGQTGENS